MWVINYEFGVKAEVGLEEMEMEPPYYIVRIKS